MKDTKIFIINACPGTHVPLVHLVPQISQASILGEGAKYIKSIKGEEAKVNQELEAVRKQIEELNMQIE